MDIRELIDRSPMGARQWPIIDLAGLVLTALAPTFSLLILFRLITGTGSAVYSCV